MTKRDRLWRAVGVILLVGGCGAGVSGEDGSPMILLCFLSAMTGIVLMFNGKRVSIALQAERRGHCNTAGAIHAHRLRQFQKSEGRQHSNPVAGDR